MADESISKLMRQASILILQMCPVIKNLALEGNTQRYMGLKSIKFE